MGDYYKKGHAGQAEIVSQSSNSSAENPYQSNELGVNNTGTPVAVKHENIKYVGKNYHPDLVHPESISFDSTFTDSIISGKTYEINSEGQSLSPLVPTPIPKTKTIDNFSQKYKQSAQHQPPQHTTTLPYKNQSTRQQTNQNNQTL